MVRPVKFGYNTETAVTNAFQQSSGLTPSEIQEKTLHEFEMLVQALRNEGVEVIVVDDTHEPHKPDSIFPNNWISFHESGHVMLYPMLAENRRRERRSDIIEKIKELRQLELLHDLSDHETTEKYLEGTGSIVFDYKNHIAYAVRSPRTHEELVEEVCAKLGYKPVVFSACDRHGQPVYHTNVVMCVGESFAVICLECIDKQERDRVISELKNTGKEIVDISFGQVEKFAGNMYELVNNQGKNLLLMSEQAKLSLTDDQVATLQKYCKIISSPLYTIELHGGGSARCMVADIRLPKKK